VIRRGLLAILGSVLLCAGGCLLTEQGWLAAKAGVAELLIERALRAHLRDGENHRPWSWADTHPIARLEVPRLNVRRRVLAGASGSSLAFGPGHVDGTAQPNRPGNCAVAGHRDSWFAFLEKLRIDDEIVVRARSGVRRYRVTDIAVHRDSDVGVLEPGAETRLTLITCYPFDGLRGSPWRYVVTCRESASTTG